VAVDEDATVGETIEKLRHLSEDHESVYYVYTLDAAKKLAGALSLRSLVLADNDTKVFELAAREMVTVSPDDDQEIVADTISKYNLLSVPVVDENGTLIGIVTVDDALDVLEEEHSEDLQIAGAGGLTRDTEAYKLGSLLIWLLRKHMWFILWALVAILATMSGYLPQVFPALVFAPFVLLIAGEMVSYAMNDLLEYGSATTTVRARRLFIRNIVAALFVAVAAGVFAFVILAALGSGVDDGSSLSANLHPVQYLLLYGFLPAIAAALLIVIVSATITVVARRRLEKDKPLSVIPTTLLMMALGLIVQIGLQVLLMRLDIFSGLLG
jgi:Mg/Co/Ni transporter MgtE